MAINPWKTLSSKYLVKDRWLKLRADTCETDSGIIIDPFYILEKDDWTQVVGFDDVGRVLIVRQYRHGSQTICAEIPCGVIDEDDASPLDAAKRELLEETGCVPKKMESLGVFYANPARQTNRVHSFVAYGVKKITDQNLDKTEEIEFEFVEVEALLAMIDSGEFAQSLHVSSVLLALRKHKLL